MNEKRRRSIVFIQQTQKDASDCRENEEEEPFLRATNFSTVCACCWHDLSTICQPILQARPSLRTFFSGKERGGIFLKCKALEEPGWKRSMSETQTPPKLLLNKPKKGLQPPGAEKGEPAPSVAMRQPASTPGKAPFWYRFRAAFGALLLVNLGIGGYVLFGPNFKAKTVEKAAETESETQAEKRREVSEQAPASIMASTNAAPEWVPPPPKVMVSPEQQREVLQWMLEEKRKVKPQSKADKARINEEKRFLKELIRGNEFPTLL